LWGGLIGLKIVNRRQEGGRVRDWLGKESWCSDFNKGEVPEGGKGT